MYFMVCTRRHSKESNLISLRCWCKIHFFCLSSESSLFDFVFIFVSNPKMVFQPTKPCFESFLPQTMLNNLLYIIAQRSSYLSLQMNQLTSIHSWMIKSDDTQWIDYVLCKNYLESTSFPMINLLHVIAKVQIHHPLLAKTHCRKDAMSTNILK